MKSLFRQFSVPLILFGCFFMAFTVSSRKDMRIRCDVAAGQLERSAANISGVLRPIVTEMIERHHDDFDSLKKLLGELTKTTDVVLVRLELGEKKFLAVPEKLPNVPPDCSCPYKDQIGRYFYYESMLEVSEEAVRSICKQSGNQIRLVIALPLEECRLAEEDAYDAFKVRMAWSIVVGIAFLTACGFSIKNFNLKRLLSFARKRELQYKEFNLAASGLAHETKNPLSIIRGQAECLLQDDLCGEDVEDIAEQILYQADRTVDRLGDFMNYARIEARNKDCFDLAVFIKRLASGLEPAFRENGIKLTVDVESVDVEADKSILHDVLINLMMNSMEAISGQGEVQVTVKRQGGALSLSVSDNGCGIPEKLQEDVFTPYVSGKKGGHGIGLSIVKRCVEASGWTIDFTTGESGTVFIISGIKVSE